MSGLGKCPFCGSEAKMTLTKPHDGHGLLWETQLRCCNCSAKMDLVAGTKNAQDRDAEWLTGQWNRRTPDAQALELNLEIASDAAAKALNERDKWHSMTKELVLVLNRTKNLLYASFRDAPPELWDNVLNEIGIPQVIEKAAKLEE